MIYVQFVEDDKGDTVDARYYCSGFCFTEDTGVSSYGHGWPCPQDTDYDVYCACCDARLWRGLGES